MSFSISKKLYRCPGCHDYIPVGSEHVLVSYLGPDGSSFYQHWHRGCARSVRRDLRDIKTAQPMGFSRSRPRGPRRRGR